MALGDDLGTEVRQIFAEQWTTSKGIAKNLKLANDSRHFARATILYADLSGSTTLVDAHPWTMAGEIYKTYLACAARVIRSMGGEIVAYDGDRVMAVFISDMQTSNAANALCRSIGP